jgi:hypothetical protein
VLSVAEEAGLAGAAAETDAFAFLTGLLDSQSLRSWMERPLTGLRASVRALGDILRKRQPHLAAHLAAEGADLGLLALPWFQTLLTSLTPLPRATLCRIWECWLWDGTLKIFFRTSLTLFAHAERALMGRSLEFVSDALRHFPPPLDQDLDVLSLIGGACTTMVTNKSLKPIILAAEAVVKEADSMSPQAKASDAIASVAETIERIDLDVAMNGGGTPLPETDSVECGGAPGVALESPNGELTDLLA